MTIEIHFKRHGKWIQMQPPGGMLTPDTLGEIAMIGNRFAARSVHPGAFQDLWLSFANHSRAKEAATHLEQNERFRNSNGADLFICSASSVQYEKTTPWATESVYLDLIDACIPVERRFSLSICDPLQSLTPLYSCDVNLLASPIQHHWHLIMLNQERLPIQAPFLIPTFQIPAILNRLSDHGTFSVDVFEPLQRSYPDSLLYGTESSIAASPERIAPYEGFCVSENPERQCLGVLRIESGFRPIFLDELAYFSRKHHVGRIFLTSLHSLFLKNIATEAVDDWKNLLGRHGLNLRHDDVSLNWQVEHGYERIRSRIIKMLRASEAAGGLSIAVGQTALSQDRAIAIVPARSFLFQKAYRVYHRHDSQRHRTAWHGTGERMTATQVGHHIKDLYQIYCNLFTRPSLSAAAVPEMRHEPIIRSSLSSDAREAYSCVECMTVYEPERGDPRQDIPPHTAFERLPEDYECSVCGSTRFEKMEAGNSVTDQATPESPSLTAGFG